MLGPRVLRLPFWHFNFANNQIDQNRYTSASTSWRSCDRVICLISCDLHGFRGMISEHISAHLLALCLGMKSPRKAKNYWLKNCWPKIFGPSNYHRWFWCWSGVGSVGPTRDPTEPYVSSMFQVLFRRILTESSVFMSCPQKTKPQPQFIYFSGRRPRTDGQNLSWFSLVKTHTWTLKIDQTLTSGNDHPPNQSAKVNCVNLPSCARYHDFVHYSYLVYPQFYDFALSENPEARTMVYHHFLIDLDRFGLCYHDFSDTPSSLKSIHLCYFNCQDVHMVLFFLPKDVHICSSWTFDAVNSPHVVGVTAIVLGFRYIPHRIHVWYIWCAIYHQYTPVMLAYIPYMDPMGTMLGFPCHHGVGWFGCFSHQIPMERYLSMLLKSPRYSRWNPSVSRFNHHLSLSKYHLCCFNRNFCWLNLVKSPFVLVQSLLFPVCNPPFSWIFRDKVSGPSRERSARFNDPCFAEPGRCGVGFHRGVGRMVTIKMGVAPQKSSISNDGILPALNHPASWGYPYDSGNHHINTYKPSDEP